MDSLLFKTFGSLLIIVILIFAILYIVRKYVFKDIKYGKNSGILSVVGQIALQPKKYIYLVKVLDKIVIVGISDNSISNLGEISDPEKISKMELIVSEKHSFAHKNFFDILKENIGIRK